MKHQVFVIHGGNALNSYEEYLTYLRAKQVSLEDLRSMDWKSSLEQKLPPEFEVFLPQMPNKQNAKYEEWKIYFEKFIPLMNQEVVFVGHSLGGIFLAKYLSEHVFPKKIRATFLVAAPFNTPEIHPLADFVLSPSLTLFEQQGGEIHLYQSQDDHIVPVSNGEAYRQALPDARYHSFEDRGHFNAQDFPELYVHVAHLYPSVHRD